MVTKYSEEQLLEYKDATVVPNGADLTAFVKMVDEVKVALNALYDHDEHHTGTRRRSSVSHRPVFARKFKAKELPPQPDADGWITTSTKQKKPSFGGVEAEGERETFKEAFVRARPNNKNIGSSKPADPREIADKQNKAFNAFDALVSDEEEDDDDDDEEEED